MERWANEALRLGEVTGQPDSISLSHGSLGMLRILQGRYEEADGLIRPVIEQFPAAAYSAMLAWSLAEQGRTDEARAILDRVLAGRGGSPAPTRQNVGSKRLLQAAAEAEVHDACLWTPLAAATGAQGNSTALVGTPETVGVTGSGRVGGLSTTEVAAELYELLLPSRAAMATGQTAWAGPVTHDLGLLATVMERYDEAEEHFAAAVEVQDRIGAQGMVVHTRLAWGRMLLRRAGTNDASRARTLLEEAKAGAREVKIPAIEARVDELLAQVPT